MAFPPAAYCAGPIPLARPSSHAEYPALLPHNPHRHLHSYSITPLIVHTRPHNTRAPWLAPAPCPQPAYPAALPLQLLQVL